MIFLKLLLKWLCCWHWPRSSCRRNLVERSLSDSSTCSSSASISSTSIGLFRHLATLFPLSVNQSNFHLLKHLLTEKILCTFIRFNSILKLITVIFISSSVILVGFSVLVAIAATNWLTAPKSSPPAWILKSLNALHGFPYSMCPLLPTVIRFLYFQTIWTNFFPFLIVNLNDKF